MRRMLMSIFCCLVLATLFVERAGAQHGGVKFAAEVPLLDCNGLPCVEARMGTGPNLKMGIDTGNVDSVLDLSYAEAAGLKSTAPLPAGAPSGMFRTVIPSISVGSVIPRSPMVAVLASARSHASRANFASTSPGCVEMLI